MTLVRVCWQNLLREEAAASPMEGARRNQKPDLEWRETSSLLHGFSITSICTRLWAASLDRRDSEQVCGSLKTRDTEVAIGCSDIERHSLTWRRLVGLLISLDRLLLSLLFHLPQARSPEGPNNRA